MAVIQSLQAHRIALKLNAGANPLTGKMIVKSTALGGFAEAADNEKIMALVDLAAPVLKHPVVQVARTAVFMLEKA